jgi:hypothetical protein
MMIDVLQRTAAAQATRLNVLTEWQKAYTDELNQIHAFVANNGDQEGTFNPTGSEQANNYTLTRKDLTDSTVQSGDLPVVFTTGSENYDGPSYIYNRGNAQFLVSGSHSLVNDNTSSGKPNGGAPNFQQDYHTGDTIEFITTSGGKGAIDGSSDEAVKARADLTTTNSTFTQQIQGNINVVSNDAKALQANVNQSNDAVQSQSDIATSILQQMSTILTSIYQSA